MFLFWAVVRQLAEAVAEMEEAQAAGEVAPKQAEAHTYSVDDDEHSGGGFELADGPVVSIEAVQKALANNEIDNICSPSFRCRNAAHLAMN